MSKLKQAFVDKDKFLNPDDTEVVSAFNKILAALKKLQAAGYVIEFNDAPDLEKAMVPVGSDNYVYNRKDITRIELKILNTDGAKEPFVIGIDRNYDDSEGKTISRFYKGGISVYKASLAQVKEPFGWKHEITFTKETSRRYDLDKDGIKQFVNDLTNFIKENGLKGRKPSQPSGPA